MGKQPLPSHILTAMKSAGGQRHWMAPTSPHSNPSHFQLFSAQVSLARSSPIAITRHQMQTHPRQSFPETVQTIHSQSMGGSTCARVFRLAGDWPTLLSTSLSDPHSLEIHNTECVHTIIYPLLHNAMWIYCPDRKVRHTA